MTAHSQLNGTAMKILSGNSNRPLTEAIAAYIGVPLTKCQVRRFADMEVFVEIQENVRGQDTFVVQSTSYPANDHLMELLIMTDALRRASARRITAVVPYFGYARQDRKPGPRTPISAKLVANLITHAGADRVLTVDLHAGQIQGFFDIPTDNLFAAPVMVSDIKARMPLDNLMVVSPDVGGVVRARAFAKRIEAPLAIIDKRRERAGESEVMNVIGDVAGKTCVLVDDIVDSGGTLCNAADALMREGAKDVRAYITHGVLSGGAVARIAASHLKELVLTDTIEPTEVGAHVEQYPRRFDRAFDRRSDCAHGQGRERLEPVRLRRCSLRRSGPQTRSRGLLLRRKERPQQPRDDEHYARAEDEPGRPHRIREIEIGRDDHQHRRACLEAVPAGFAEGGRSGCNSADGGEREDIEIAEEPARDALKKEQRENPAHDDRLGHIELRLHEEMHRAEDRDSIDDLMQLSPALSRRAGESSHRSR